MELYLVILAALAPVAIALFYVFRKDSKQPEPAAQLAKAFGFGVLSVFLSFVFSVPASSIVGVEDEGCETVFDAMADAFFTAAIPEEVAKLIMLWLLLRTNRFFDEKFDGIIYAVFVGMGFAGLENIMYLFEGLEDGSWVATGIVRALFSIPGHFLFAVLMGYYYSIYHFGIDRSLKAKAMILIAPVLAHGIFDAILMSTDIEEDYAALFMPVFLVFFFVLRKIGKRRIARLINQ